MFLDLAIKFEADPAPPVRRTVDTVINEAGIQLTEQIRSRWPRDTGRSRKGWKIEGTGRDWVIVNQTPYTAWISRTGQRADLVDTLIPALLTDSVNKTAEALADQLPAALLSEVKNG